jgi:hypothetical protein
MRENFKEAQVMTKTRTKFFYLTAICLTLISATVFGALTVSASKDGSEPLSTALAVIAEDSGMAMAGLIGNEIKFEAEDFARALNVSKISAIEITDVPDVSAGELRVGSTVINSGARISASSLEKMTYTASSRESTRATFRFRPEGAGYDLPCELYLLSEMNYAPTLQDVPETYLQVSTHKGITLFGTLPCYDPDGDETVIEIVSYPESGSLILTDKRTGDYTYTPTKNYSGKDSFTYVARDKYGNYSAAQKVSLTVTKPTLSVSFDDMNNSPAYNAALTMVEEGIMSGVKVGAGNYFYPDGKVTRGEFLVMAMHAAGIEDVSSSLSTPFNDDANIPEHMRGYVAMAYRLGYIKGIPEESGACFYAERPITRAEAAVMLGNILDVSTPDVLPTFADSDDIPTWAATSVYGLGAIGVMNVNQGSVTPLQTLTRADAAQMLCGAMRYMK